MKYETVWEKKELGSWQRWPCVCCVTIKGVVRFLNACAPQIEKVNASLEDEDKEKDAASTSDAASSMAAMRMEVINRSVSIEQVRSLLWISSRWSLVSAWASVVLIDGDWAILVMQCCSTA